MTVNEWVSVPVCPPPLTSPSPLVLSVMLLRYFYSLSPVLPLPPSCSIGCTALPLLLSAALCLSRCCTLAGFKPSPLFFFPASVRQERVRQR